MRSFAGDGSRVDTGILQTDWGRVGWTIVDDAYIARAVGTLRGSEIVRGRRLGRIVVSYPALVRFVASDRNLTIADTRRAIRDWANRYGLIDHQAKPPLIEIDQAAWDTLIAEHSSD